MTTGPPAVGSRAAFVGVDAVVVRVPSLDAGLAFYRDVLGHELLWRRTDAAALRMGDSGVELVLSTTLDPETDVVVSDLSATLAKVTSGGGRLSAGPDELDVGRVAVVADPFGNVLTLIELSKGRYVTAADGTVTGVAPREGRPS